MVYDSCGVEREPAKAADTEGMLEWSTLGAEQGQGLIGSALDFRSTFVELSWVARSTCFATKVETFGSRKC